MTHEAQAAVVVTGASTGIGRTIALALDANGFRVFAGVRKEADGLALSREARHGLTSVLLDVTDESAIGRAVDSAARLQALAEGRDAPAEPMGWAPLVDGWRSGLVAGTVLLLIHAAAGLAGDRERGGAATAPGSWIIASSAVDGFGVPGGDSDDTGTTPGTGNELIGIVAWSTTVTNGSATFLPIMSE